MRIAVVHGYFLQGTGSNLFVANLCRELCLLGHEVLLFCQEQYPEKLDFVSQFTEFSNDNREILIRFKQDTVYPGKCLCYRPNLGGKLPVYVFDNYEGYQVKTFTDLLEIEMEEYIQCNTIALHRILSVHTPDLILSNHIIMQPMYVQRAQEMMGHVPQIPHFVTVHGSCLNFAVRKSEIVKKYAYEVIAKVDRLVFVSEFSCKEFKEFFHDVPSIEIKADVISAGVDVDRFQPLLAEGEKASRMKLVVDYLQKNGITRQPMFMNITPRLVDLRQEGKEMWLPDANAADDIQSIDWMESKLILYYGKYLWTKGIHILIATAPLVLQNHPDTYYLLVGFGEFRGYLEQMVAALHQGREDLFRSIITAREGELSEHSSGNLYFSLLLKKLDDPKFAHEYFSAAKGKIGHHIIFTGFLPHNCLSQLIPCAEITVATSIFPEAFGMVAIEALASGVIPLQTNHSGFSEVIRKYSVPFEEFFQGYSLKPLYLDEYLVFNLANNICQFLDYYSSIDPQKRNEIRQLAKKIASQYSWGSMVDQYLKLLKN